VNAHVPVPSTVNVTGSLRVAGVGAADTFAMRGLAGAGAALPTCTASVNFPVHGGCALTTIA
jgi:hypothetical protein